MKQNIKKLCRAITFALAAVLLVSSAAPAVAATTKAKTPTVTAGTDATAPTLKLNKAYVVKDKKENGYTKFVAPATAKYVVTVSNLHLTGVKQNTKKDKVMAALHLEKNIGQYEEVKTRGGKSTFFNFGSKVAAEKPAEKENSEEIYKFLAQRSAEISLKKGQKLYLSAHDFRKGAFNYQIKITKKK